MKHSYRQFQMDVVALAPIHIGSGEKYTSREFIYENKNYYFPDMGKFYQEMIRLGLAEKYERFLIEPKNKKKRLNDFLYQNGIQMRNFGGYVLEETGFEKTESTRGTLNDISKFIRDGLGQPYVPGSSLKGAIRTILMNTKWKNKDFVDRKGRKPKEYKSAIPWGQKKGQALNDIFHDIRVSDSQPLENDNLTIVQKWDYSLTPKKDKVTPIPLYRESLKPFTRLQFTITTTSDKAYELISELATYASQFYQEYKSFFLNEKSKEEYIQDNIQYPIYLGGGSGVWTKTVMRQANGIVQKRYVKMKTKMVGKGVVKLTKAPQFNEDKRLIKNQDSLYEMGKSYFTIKEIE
ncbi:type III-A CRISPR-associated RAMP protein Csm5 [Streptococcus tangpeifui]|uniref:type III-A CRISPR-associated RAMP protein Csm5 n=1 Tax=Streptococcus tangpeifui TaxID=2709400 RepID=UPI0013EB0B64|nr:type III-A CRISPR-associated RAMP protein Csm5 [Streptococcus sp. ZJ1593]